MLVRSSGGLTKISPVKYFTKKTIAIGYILKANVSSNLLVTFLYAFKTKQ